MSFDQEPDGDPHGECAAEIHRLTAENEALRRDAARYRWLRMIYFSGGVAAHHLGRCDTAEDLDVAIDAAINGAVDQAIADCERAARKAVK